jgi:hypothetical protein
MNAVVFAGPTIAARDITAIVDAVCLPPAAQGDVYRIALERPRAIGIIDGYFEGRRHLRGLPGWRARRRR